jgi:hypothetical protein
MGDSGTWTGVGVKPILASVVVNGDVVRATFSESMTVDLPFLDPASYVFTALGGGSVAVIAASVSPGPGTNPTYIDISLSHSLTFGTANYRLTVAATLTDKAGNPMDSSGRSVDFNGSGVRATISAVAYPANLEKVRVHYSKSVKQVNPSNIDDALHVANYSITGGVSVGSVTHINSQVVELQVSGQQNGHSYTLTVMSVQDLSNNEVAP